MNPSIDLQALLDQTFFGLDTQAMLGDVEDFIDFSESNIDWQKRRDLRRAEQECADMRFDDPRDAASYHDQRIQGVIYRFEVSLTQRVRYAALVALITTIEWALIALTNRAKFTVPKRAESKNEAVHVLEVFDRESSFGLGSQIQVIEILVQVRNCIVHAAGLLDSYRHANELRQRLSGFSGIKVSNITHLGDGIEIESGFLQGTIEKIKSWIHDLEKSLREKALIS